MFNKSTLTAATLAVFMASGTITTASAVAIADGNYTIEIQLTPDLVPDLYIADIGADGAYNSSFIFGALPVTGISNGMFDIAVADVGGVSTVAGNGNAGEIGISISGGSISVTSFQVDTITSTAGGNFAQDAANGFGSLSGSTSAGITTLDLGGRVGYMDGVPGFDTGRYWGYAGFTTASSSNLSGTVNGTAVTNIGDVNADGIDDYTAAFVAAGEVGVEWPGFTGAQYVETWNVQILSQVPVPAAVWLFGSGLAGLAGVACRRQV
jgi:hypothetical protein